MSTPKKPKKGAPSGASESWRIEFGDAESEVRAIRGQRAIARQLATLIESGETLTGLHAKWAGTIVAGMASHFPRSARRPPKNEPELRAAFAAACERAGAAILSGTPIIRDDRPSAAEAVRAWARRLRSSKGKGRRAKVPGDAAVIVEIAKLNGTSKRATRAEIAERAAVDVSNVERAVAKQRNDAVAFLEWAGAFGATTHPKRRK